MKARLLWGVGLSTILLMASSVLFAQDGVKGALARIDGTSVFTAPFSRLHGPTIAVADFDGDDKPDGAVLLQTPSGDGNSEVELHLTNNGNTSLKIESYGPVITVEARDIDHDGDIDLIIKQSLTGKRLQVWINDGHGNFEKGHTEDYPSEIASTSLQLSSSPTLEYPSVSLSTQRGFETMLLASHIAGRPPSESDLAFSPTDLFRADHTPSLNHSRAPPLT